MFGNPYGTGLTLPKVLSGISKTLNVANQEIPTNRKHKPIINTAKTIFSTLKEFGKSSNNTSRTSTSTQKETTKKDTAPTSRVVSSNNPKFFL